MRGVRMYPSVSAIEASAGRRVFLSFVAGLFLLAAVVGPAAAFVPFVVAGAEAIIGGTVVRSVIGGVATRVALPVAESVAAKISAANVLGVIGTGMVVVCGNNYLSGNDCQGVPLVKIRPKNHTGNDSETATTTLPATQNSQAATSTTNYTANLSASACVGSYQGPRSDLSGAVVAQEICTRVAKNQYGTCSSSGVGVVTNVVLPAGSFTCESLWNGSHLATNNMQLSGVVNAGDTLSCPGGWTLSGSNCVQNVCPAGGTYNFQTGVCDMATTVWAPDGVASFRTTGGSGFVADPMDPDSVGQTFSNPTAGKAKQPNGRPMQYRITEESDGSLRVETWAEVVNPAGNTNVVDNVVKLNPNGAVIEASTNVLNGDLNTVVAQLPRTTQTPTVDFPTDYARENTLAAVKTEVQKLNTDGLKLKETGTPTTLPTEVATAQAAYDAAKVSNDNAIQALPSTTIPGVPIPASSLPFANWGDGACQTFDVPMPGGTRVMDLCPHIDSYLRPFLATLYGAAVVVYAFMAGHRAIQGA